MGRLNNGQLLTECLVRVEPLPGLTARHERRQPAGGMSSPALGPPARNGSPAWKVNLKLTCVLSAVPTAIECTSALTRDQGAPAHLAGSAGSGVLYVGSETRWVPRSARRCSEAYARPAAASAAMSSCRAPLLH